MSLFRRALSLVDPADRALVGDLLQAGVLIAMGLIGGAMVLGAAVRVFTVVGGF